MPIIYFDEIDSTNSYLKREYRGLADRTVVYAKHQTAGKGRLGRTWLDDGSSLTFSILLKDRLDEKRASLLPLLVGASVYNAFLAYGVKSSIKWPNDVLIDGRKCTGILLEAVTEKKLEALIIGIGINVNNIDFPEDIKKKATSLRLVTGKEINREELLQTCLDKFDELYSGYLDKDDSFMKIVKDNSYLDGKDITLNYYGENRKCKVMSIAEDGRLEVLENGKVDYLSSGEVTLTKNY